MLGGRVCDDRGLLRRRLGAREVEPERDVRSRRRQQLDRPHEQPCSRRGVAAPQRTAAGRGDELARALRQLLVWPP
jgi:hypothetical protein